MTDRETFEAWLQQSKIEGTVRELHVAWAAWQAALASERAKQAEPVAFLQNAVIDNYLMPGQYETCSKDDYGAFPVYAAPPAVQAEPVAWRYENLHTGAVSLMQERSSSGCFTLSERTYIETPLYASTPADDEAVRLLREAQCWVGAALADEIDAYLAKVTSK